MDEKRILDSIELPKGVSSLDAKQLEKLCAEIRAEIINQVSKTGGHLASNLGAVELTTALHKVFISPDDKIVWDVGHQCYAHKLLTGRGLAGIRHEGGVSGFPKPSESVHDAFVAGHASNSVSAALGIATAKALSGDDGATIAVVGDGAFGGGMIYEAMNNAGRSGRRLIVVLNDNEMSISKNVGAMAKYLAQIRSKKSYFTFKDNLEKFLRSIPLIGLPLRNGLSKIKTVFKELFYGSNFFEHFGFVYLGPVDGHDISMLCRVFERAKQLEKPVLVHVNTVKGKGYTPSEARPSAFHGVSAFNPETGEPLCRSGESFSDVFGSCLSGLADKDFRICAITAAMKDGTGLAGFAEKFPERFFDVGIEEEHALTFSAGLAAGGCCPVLAIYSTFLQRSFDQLIHDASIEPRHVVLAIDRAGIVGDDGETHQGIFDLPMLTAVPGTTVFCPFSYSELRRDLSTAVAGSGVYAVRYPRGVQPELPTTYCREFNESDFFGHDESEALIVVYGRLFAEAATAAESCGADLLKLGRVFPLPEEALDTAMKYKYVYFFEESIRHGSIGEHFAAALLERGFLGAFHLTALDSFIPHMTVPAALKKYGLDSSSMIKTVLEGRCQL